jgi:hypothetical protein
MCKICEVDRSIYHCNVCDIDIRARNREKHEQSSEHKRCLQTGDTYSKTLHQQNLRIE